MPVRSQLRPCLNYSTRLDMSVSHISPATIPKSSMACDFKDKPICANSGNWCEASICLPIHFTKRTSCIQLLTHRTISQITHDGFVRCNIFFVA